MSGDELCAIRLAILGGRDEHGKGFAPHDSGVVSGHVQRLARRNYEIREGLYVSHAHRPPLDPGKVFLCLDEFRRQVQLVIRPGSEPSRQHHRRLADRHRPLAPVQQVAAAQVLAELAGVLRAAGERLHFRRRRRLGSDEDRENIDAGREADCRGRGVRDGQQYELLHCDLGDAMTGTILNSIRSLHMRANSVKAAAVSLSSKSSPPLKSAAVQRPRSLTPLGGWPPVFLNRAIASSRPFVSGFKVKVNMNFMSTSFPSLSCQMVVYFVVAWNSTALALRRVMPCLALHQG